MYFLNVLTITTIKSGLIYGGTFVCITGLSLFISSLIISNLLYDKHNHFYEESIDIELIPILDEFKDIEKYNENYLEELDSIENKELSQDFIDGLKNNIVFDETPVGKIVMMYDKHLEGFRWYCNTSHVTYEILSTLARKYVINYDCKNLYISLEDELDKNKKILEKTIEEAEKNKSKQKIELLKRKDVTDKLLIKNNIIKFKYSGKLYEYENTVNKKEPPTKVKKITFSDFKKLKLG